MALLRDLDSVVTDFSSLIAESRRRRMRMVDSSAASRHSFESMNEEFYDANDGNATPLLTVTRDSDEEAARTETEVDDRSDSDESEVNSDVEDAKGLRRRVTEPGLISSLFPARKRTLVPLPLPPVKRRITVTSPTVMPPSLIGFLRKNVGKDLSTISMPVSANEPTSLLQRSAEALEYSELLDTAAITENPGERLLYVTAFAISSLSNARVKDRAIRKPFNPMLGETYELIREDKGFRFISEKISHHPPQLAYQAEAKDWTFMQSPAPTQKFWGKSAEIITEGKARLILHTTRECFSWSMPNSFLRNIIAGEKYVEPVGTMTVLNESNLFKAVATFKAKGMWSGRSEEVAVSAYSQLDEELPQELHGTWTSSLSMGSQTIWTAGGLVDNPSKHYGMTTFAAALNELTDIEHGKIPETDSRLRPDQRALEEGDVDTAEDLKTRLEERQRVRRKALEAKGKSWEPRWFSKVESGDGDVVWSRKTGEEGYWEERAKGEWRDVPRVFEV